MHSRAKKKTKRERYRLSSRQRRPSDHEGFAHVAALESLVRATSASAKVRLTFVRQGRRLVLIELISITDENEQPSHHRYGSSAATYVFFWYFSNFACILPVPETRLV